MRKIYCLQCGKWFHSLGYSRHRTMHYENTQKAFKELKNQMKKLEKVFDSMGIKRKVILSDPFIKTRRLKITKKDKYAKS